MRARCAAWRLMYGWASGRPRQTGDTLLLGAAPKLVGQPQKILVRVASCTWTSRPITASYLAMTSGEATAAMLHYSETVCGAIVTRVAAQTWRHIYVTMLS